MENSSTRQSFPTQPLLAISYLWRSFRPSTMTLKQKGRPGDCIVVTEGVEGYQCGTAFSAFSGNKDSHLDKLFVSLKLVYVVSLCCYQRAHIGLLYGMQSSGPGGTVRIRGGLYVLTRQFVQQLVQDKDKEKSKLRITDPLWGESAGYRWIPSQWASNAKSVSAWGPSSSLLCRVPQSP